jgi:hypothetical protein
MVVVFPESTAIDVVWSGKIIFDKTGCSLQAKPGEQYSSLKLPLHESHKRYTNSSVD